MSKLIITSILTLLFFLIIIPNAYSEPVLLNIPDTNFNINLDSDTLLIPNDISTNNMYMLYMLPEYTFPVGGAIALNIIPGFGLGSFLQKDKTAGTVQLAVSLVSTTVGIIFIKYGLMGGAGDGGFMSGNGELTTGIIILTAGLGGSMIFGIISAIVYNGKNPSNNNENDVEADNIDAGIYINSKGFSYKISW